MLSKLKKIGLGVAAVSGAAVGGAAVAGAATSHSGTTTTAGQPPPALRNMPAHSTAALHSTIVMTQRYSHVLGPMVVDAADRLEALFARTAAR